MIMEKSDESWDPGSILRQMERLLGGAAQGKADEAQELVYEAWEAPDDETAYDLLTQALELDPTNVDAWMGLLDYAPLGPEERIESLRRLVSVAEDNLGEQAFREDKGHFWGLLETRPYMRARGHLAMSLMEAGRLEESIIEHEAILELNPNDNQGMRYGLLSLYLSLKRLDGAARLFEQYNERDFSAVFAWGYVLERYLSRDTTAAISALKAARKQNPHAAAYALGHRKLPKRMPASYSMGSKEEAVIAWDIPKPAWEKHPEAEAWLRAQCGK